MTSSTEASPTPKVAVNDIGSQEAFLAAIDETIKYFNDGDIVEGTVVKVDRDEVLLDIGYKTEGVIPSRELSIKHDVDPHDVVKVTDHIEALVLQKEDKEGRLILSKKRAQYERAWGTIEKIKDDDGVVTGTVIEVVKGGLILDIGLRGFLPASLVEMRRVRDLQPYVGREIEAKIIELDKNRNNVVLSRRAWLEQTQSEVRQNFLNTLQRGQIRKGVVSSIVNFGAFVDLGGVDGLVHVSELSWKHIDHPGEVVEVGQEVTVEVLDVDMDRERVSLSLKSTQEDPWQQFARTHQIGQVVPGRVTKLVPFGAFVRVEEGIEGLVHISELADRHVEIPEQVVQVGDEIFVKIIDIDLDRRRISLSLKQANEGTIGEAVGDDFDPTLYGMPATYDDQGNYVYPDGFDAETGEWLEGYDTQREEWERQYAQARSRFEAHRRQVAEARKADTGDEGGDERRRSSGTHTPAPGPRRIRRRAGLRRGAGRAARQAVRRPELTGRCSAATSSVRGGQATDRLPGVGGGMLKVGLTGGIGSGKSEVSRRLAGYGALIIDADRIAREVVEPGTPGLAQVVGAFGAGRAGRGRHAGPGRRSARSSSPTRSCAAKLNAIVHPLVGDRMRELEQGADPDAIVVEDIPLIAENDMAGFFDLVVVVDVPPRIQEERLIREREHDPGAGRRPGWPRRPAGSSGWPSPTSCWTTPVRWPSWTGRSATCGPSCRRLARSGRRGRPVRPRKYSGRVIEFNFLEGGGAVRPVSDLQRRVAPFEVITDMIPAGDQPRAIAEMERRITSGDKDTVLLGATGTGKTATVAWLAERLQRPVLVMLPNKTLAAQFANELREMLPQNAVEYFVSYYDYYQPEAYIPQTDTYIEKDSSINDEVERLRHSATNSLLTRRDTIVVASVSCIYGLGTPQEYVDRMVKLKVGDSTDRDTLLRRLVGMQYTRNDLAFTRGTFRVRGDTIEIIPVYEELAVRIEMFGDEIERLMTLHPLTGEVISEDDELYIFPASHYVAGPARMERAIAGIEAELAERLGELEQAGKLLEAQRLRMRTTYDIEMLRQVGSCAGIENYSRHIDGREAGSPPNTLLDYFPEDFLLVIDESHNTVPQIGAMYEGDVSRKRNLVEHGFRLPSAIDNRPLTWDEFGERIGQTVYLSATPGPYELQRVGGDVVEQVIRPTGLVDPAGDRQADQGPDRRPGARDPGPGGALGTGAGHHADQEDGRGPHRLPAGARHPGALPAQRGGHAAPGGAAPRAARRRVRRAGRHQPAPRGPGPARGVAGVHPGRGQGRASCAPARR